MAPVPRGERPATRRGATARKSGRRGADVRRPRAILVGSALVSALVLVAWFPAGSLYRQHAALAKASSQLHALHQQDTALAQERKNLSDAAEIARIAREQYQLVSPGQQAYEVLPSSGSASPGAAYAGDPGLASPAVPSASSELPPGSASGSGTHTSGPHAGSAPAGATSQSPFERMLHALEFWR